MFSKRYSFKFAFFSLFSLALIGFSISPVHASRTIRVTPQPASGIAPLEVKLIVTVRAGTEVPEKYTMDFGDGSPEETIETEQYRTTFTHTYGPGFFKPTATVVKKEIGVNTTSDPASLIVAKWKFQTNDEIDSSPAVGPEGTVYAGSDDGNLYAIDSENGKEIWRFKTGDEIRSSPAVGPNGTIYIGSLDGRLYAIKPNGDLKWSFNIGDTIFSSPAIGPDGRVIYIGASDGYLYAFNASGTLKWKFFGAGKIVSSPSIGHDGIEHVVYFGSTAAHLYAVAADNGDLKWSFPTKAEVYASPAIGKDGKIYFGECRVEEAEEYNFKFYCLNPDGTQNWSFTDGTGFYSSPAIGPDGLIYVGSWDGVFMAFNPDGTVNWSVRPGPPFADINSSPAVGANGVVYVGSKKEIFLALQPPGSDEDEEDKQNWVFQTGDDIVYSSPVIDAEGTIYFGSRDGCLYAVNPGNFSLPANSAWPMFQRNAPRNGLAEDISIADIISTEPIQNTTGVNRDLKQVKINFSPDIDTEQIKIEEFRLKQGGTAVEGFTFLDFTRYNNVGFRPTAIFERIDEDTPLPYNKIYEASISYYKKNPDSTPEEENKEKTFTFAFITEQEPKEERKHDPSTDFSCFIKTLSKD